MPQLNTQTITGIRVVVQPDRPRYELPEEIMPGLPWPAEFREEINAWARNFFRPVNPIGDNEMLHDRINNVVHVNSRVFERLKRAASVGEV